MRGEGFEYQLPPWAKEVRPHQLQAVDEIVAAYKAGTKMVVLDAPTGSGKTLIAELVRQRVAAGGRTSYVCSSLTLQDQFAKDFPDAAVIKGRDNYPTVYGAHKASDCQGVSCSWCPSRAECPYERAKMRAAGSELACLNTTFQLYQSAYGNSFKDRNFIVFDECDMLEAELMGFSEVVVGAKAASQVGMKIPGPGARYETVLRWLREWSDRARDHSKKVKQGKERRSWDGRVTSVMSMIEAYRDGEWVRQPHHNSLIMKPVKVEAWGGRLWDRGDRFLLMSATVISSGQLLADLGWEESFVTVRVPMTFPVENRPIYPFGMIDMSYKMKDESWPVMGDRVLEVVEAHPGENVLVHTVSYELTRFLYNRLAGKVKVHHYTSAEGRATALANFREEGGVLLAPSMDRGVDFAHDDARVVVVCKIPFPYLGDRQISTRLHTPGGQGWYNVKTVRTLVQMTGRGVRSAEDHATTYILDSQFQQLFGKNRRLFPPWWREAVRYRIPTQQGAPP